ncbi:MAG: DUF4416 family protein [Desulfurivibrionaceae bacterium]
MADPESPTPVKYFIAVLFSSPDLLSLARNVLQENWGKMDLEGDPRLFEVTDYYQAEMGGTLYRSIISFKDLMNPAEIVERKLRCNDLEDTLALENKRRVNLDAGYLDHNKVVLASAKAAGQKIYLGRGIYADLAGRYRSGRYQPFEWSFPDFKDGRYDRELLLIRKEYLRQLKNRGW